MPAGVDTKRLLLRRWRISDREPYARINADPQVMEHLGSAADRASSNADIDAFEAEWQRSGFGLYAAQLRISGELCGFLGLHTHRAFPDEVEIGWRLARSAWGYGLATEGAAAVRDLAFDRLRLRALVSITVADNRRSIRVMEKLGMHWWRTKDFEGHRLQVYRQECPEQ